MTPVSSAEGPPGASSPAAWGQRRLPGEALGPLQPPPSSSPRAPGGVWAAALPCLGGRPGDLIS